MGEHFYNIPIDLSQPKKKDDTVEAVKKRIFTTEDKDLNIVDRQGNLDKGWIVERVLPDGKVIVKKTTTENYRTKSTFHTVSQDSLNEWNQTSGEEPKQESVDEAPKTESEETVEEAPTQEVVSEDENADKPEEAAADQPKNAPIDPNDPVHHLIKSVDSDPGSHQLDFEEFRPKADENTPKKVEASAEAPEVIEYKSGDKVKVEMDGNVEDDWTYLFQSQDSKKVVVAKVGPDGKRITESVSMEDFAKHNKVTPKIETSTEGTPGETPEIKPEGASVEKPEEVKPEGESKPDSEESKPEEEAAKAEKEPAAAEIIEKCLEDKTKDHEKKMGEKYGTFWGKTRLFFKRNYLARTAISTALGAAANVIGGQSLLAWGIRSAAGMFFGRQAGESLWVTMKTRGIVKDKVDGKVDWEQMGKKLEEMKDKPEGQKLLIDMLAKGEVKFSEKGQLINSKINEKILEEDKKREEEAKVPAKTFYRMKEWWKGRSSTEKLAITAGVFLGLTFIPGVNVAAGSIAAHLGISHVGHMAGAGLVKYGMFALAGGAMSALNAEKNMTQDLSDDSRLYEETYRTLCKGKTVEEIKQLDLDIQERVKALEGEKGKWGAVGMVGLGVLANTSAMTTWFRQRGEGDLAMSQPSSGGSKTETADLLTRKGEAGGVAATLNKLSPMQGSDSLGDELAKSGGKLDATPGGGAKMVGKIIEGLSGKGQLGESVKAPELNDEMVAKMKRDGILSADGSIHDYEKFKQINPYEYSHDVLKHMDQPGGESYVSQEFKHQFAEPAATAQTDNAPEAAGHLAKAKVSVEALKDQGFVEVPKGLENQKVSLNQNQLDKILDPKNKYLDKSVITAIERATGGDLSKGHFAIIDVKNGPDQIKFQVGDQTVGHELLKNYKVDQAKAGFWGDLWDKFRGGQAGSKGKIETMEPAPGADAKPTAEVTQNKDVLPTGNGQTEHGGKIDEFAKNANQTDPERNNVDAYYDPAKKHFNISPEQAPADNKNVSGAEQNVDVEIRPKNPGAETVPPVTENLTKIDTNSSEYISFRNDYLAHHQNLTYDKIPEDFNKEELNNARRMLRWRGRVNNEIMEAYSKLAAPKK